MTHTLLYVLHVYVVLHLVPWLRMACAFRSAPLPHHTPRFSPSQGTSRVGFSASQPPADKNNPAAVIEYDDFLPQPNPHWEALDVVTACMSMMLHRKDAGLEVCFNFSSDRCQAALGGSLEKFKQYATNPVFGYLVNCCDYEVVSVGPVIAGTLTRGAMQTVLLDAIQSPADGERHRKKENRRFLWTMQKERRPPRQDCWIIHEVIYVENAYLLTT